MINKLVVSIVKGGVLMKHLELVIFILFLVFLLDLGETTKCSNSAVIASVGCRVQGIPHA